MDKHFLKRKAPSTDDSSDTSEENRIKMMKMENPPTLSPSPSVHEVLLYHRLKSAIEPTTVETHAVFGEEVEELLAHSSQTYIQEAVTRQDEQGRTLLHRLCLSIGLGSSSFPRGRVLIDHFLDADKNQISVQTQDNFGMTPLHMACGYATCRTEIIQSLLDADPTKATILMQDMNGRLPLHNLCNSRITLPTKLEFLLDADVTKKSIILPNNEQETPFDLAANCYDLPFKFQLIAKSRIELVKGPNKWRELLRNVLKDFEKDIAGNNNQGNANIMRNFVANFKKQLAYYDMLLNHGIPILELAIWKGEGLPADLEQRQQRWVTCDSTEIVKMVAEFL